MKKEIVLLGTPSLYKPSVSVGEAEDVSPILTDLRDTLAAFRAEHGFGRAIAAPQIGVNKRMIYLNIDGKETALLNPTIEFVDGEQMELWDDCMSFPGLFVRVRRYKRCRIRFLDPQRQLQEWLLEGDLSELLQHEYDHLDGIVATMRAVDSRAFAVGCRPE